MPGSATVSLYVSLSCSYIYHPYCLSVYKVGLPILYTTLRFAAKVIHPTDPCAKANQYRSGHIQGYDEGQGRCQRLEEIQDTDVDINRFLSDEVRFIHSHEPVTTLKDGS